MAAVFNFLGVLVMTAVNASVAMTIYNMVDFGGNAHISLVALCAAMAAIVIWATAAWYFGIPTSESHALIAGISGAAVAIQNSFSGINGAEWMKVIYGIIFANIATVQWGDALNIIPFEKLENEDFHIKEPYAVRQMRWDVYREYSCIGFPKPNQTFLAINNCSVKLKSKSGNRVTAEKGDLLYMPKGAEYTVTFTDAKPGTVQSTVLHFLAYSKSGEELSFGNEEVLCLINICPDARSGAQKLIR